MPDVISIVGGGWSFRQVDHAKIPGMVIAINDAGLLLKRRVDAIVTMDRLWTEHRWDLLETLKIPFYVRSGALKNIAPVRRRANWVHAFKANDLPVMDTGPQAFSTKRTALHGNNSGVCGLNLAWIQYPKTLYLFGFDMCRSPQGEAYWYPDYPWVRKGGNTKPGKYVQWANEFNSIALHFARIGTEVINVSAVSKIMNFRRVRPSDIGVQV